MSHPPKSYFLSGTVLRELSKAAAAIQTARLAAQELVPRDPLLRDLETVTQAMGRALDRANLFHQEQRDALDLEAMTAAPHPKGGR